MIEFLFYAIIFIGVYVLGYFRGYKHGSDRWPL
jgi:hypothetical protein